MDELVISLLSDTQIKTRLKKDLIIHPMLNEESQVAGCKVDLHLSGVFYEVRRSMIDSYDPLNSTSENDYRKEIIFPLGGAIVLHPGDMILAPTFENVSIPNNLLGILQGRSSLGRLGIIVHATASFIDPGFTGTITLELSNLGHLPVKLYTLSRVATIAFMTISGDVKYPYGEEIPSPLDANIPLKTNHYASPKSVASKHHEDWEYDLIRQVTKQNNSNFP